MATALAAAASISPLRSIATLVEAPSARGPDAALLELGAKFDEAYAIWVPLLVEWRRLDKIFVQEYDDEFGLRNDPGMKRYFALYEKSPVQQASDAVLLHCDRFAKQIREIPARTIAGVAVKGRVVRFDSFSPWKFLMDEADTDRVLSWLPRRDGPLGLPNSF